MDVNAILTNLKNMTLIGNTNAVNDTVKLVAYLNMAYRAEYDRVTRLYPGFVQTTQTVAVTAGVGTLAPQPHLILSVYDTTNGVTLDPTDVIEEEKCNPALDDVGIGRGYWLDGFTGLRSYPLGDASLRVRFVPQEGQLAANSGEADILLPPNFHDLLTWRTALIVAYDERDKIVGAELAYTEKAADAEWARLESYLRLRVPRVKPRTAMPGFHAY